MTTDQQATPAGKPSAKVKALIKDLGSSEEVVVSAALKQVRVDGDAHVVPALIDVLLDSDDSEQLQEEVTSVLNQLKFDSVVPPLIEALKDPKTLGFRHTIIGAFWQSGLSVHEHFMLFVDLAIMEDFETALECLTVIENVTTQPEEQELINAMEKLSYAIPSAGDKKNMLIKIKEAVNELLIGG